MGRFDLKNTKSNYVTRSPVFSQKHCLHGGQRVTLGFFQFFVEESREDLNLGIALLVGLAVRLCQYQTQEQAIPRKKRHGVPLEFSKTHGCHSICQCNL